MNQKVLGVSIIIIGIVLAGLIYYMRATDKSNVRSIVGGVFSTAIILIGLMLVLMAKTDRLIAEQQVKISSALESAAKSEKQKPS